MTVHKPQIKAVVFDLGKVLVDFDYSIAIGKIAARSKLASGQLAELMMTAPLLLDYECGKVTSQEFFDRICERTGYRGTLDEFAGHFGDIFTPIEPMIRLHGELTETGMPTFVFSNTNELAVRHIRTNFPFFSHFAGYILSYEHGCMKPAPRLYEILEQQSGLRGGDILYLDDRPENVEAGVARGWRAFVHEDPQTTVARIGQLGLLERSRI